jgi:hypothetical protein
MAASRTVDTQAWMRWSHEAKHVRWTGEWLSD